MRTAFGYAWQVVVGAITILVVLYVLGRPDDRIETIVITLGGLIYCAVVGSAVTNGHINARFAVVLARQLTEIRLAVDPNFSDQDLEADKLLFHLEMKTLLRLGILGLVSLVCLWRFFSTI